MITIQPAKSDEFGIVSGSGFVLVENGKRIDWPLLATRAEAEAEAEVADFRRSLRQLASDEASERRFLR